VRHSHFRPCIDLHDGKVKQIVGGTLNTGRGESDLRTNFVSDRTPAYYAELYRRDRLTGGHVIRLGPGNEEAALSALRAYPGGLQVGGGIRPDNAGEYLQAGASHVIVTSYVFKDGKIHYDRLKKLVETVGREHLVLDVSCKKVDENYLVVTDRWQKVTEEVVDLDLLERLSAYCDEFLIHAVDVEGKANGIEKELVTLLGNWNKRPITYAGGVHTYEDLTLIKDLGNNHLHVTIGSALDLFGGSLKWQEVLAIINKS